MATATDQAREFLAHVKRVNTGFTRSRSSIEKLLDHLDAELKKSKTPPAFAGADQRARFDSATKLCKNPKDGRLGKYRPAIWCLVKVWGGTDDYPVKPGETLRVLHVALVKYDTQAKQADAIDTRKLALETALTNVSQVTADYVNPSTRPLHGVLLAPEYLFARPSPNQDHQVGDTRHVNEGAKCTLEGWLVELSGRHKSWLLFPGTIAWKKSLTRDRDKYISRHGQAHPELTAKELGKRFDKKTDSRGEKAVKSIGQFKTTFNKGDTSKVSGDMLEVEDWAQFSPDTDWWFATDTVTPKRVKSPRTGALEYWTKDWAEARKRVKHAALTNQEKLTALQDTATKMARNTCVAMFGGKRVLKYHKMNDYHEVLDDSTKVVYVPGTRSPKCTVDGIGFGMEICLDHAMETMKKLVASDQVKAAPDFLALLSAWVNYDNAKLPPGIKYVAHCSSKQSLNAVTATKVGAVVVERDAPEAIVYSLIVSP